MPLVNAVDFLNVFHPVTVTCCRIVKSFFLLYFKDVYLIRRYMHKLHKTYSRVLLAIIDDILEVHLFLLDIEISVYHTGWTK